jgi:hypothetical protein
LSPHVANAEKDWNKEMDDQNASNAHDAAEDDRVLAVKVADGIHSNLGGRSHGAARARRLEEWLVFIRGHIVVVVWSVHFVCAFCVQFVLCF